MLFPRFRVISTLALLAATAYATPSWAEDVQVSEQAKAHFTAGVNFLQDPEGARYEDAYREFKAAYADSPSWKILGNLGLAAMKLERDGEAIDAYTKYLKEGGSNIEPDERAQMERDLQSLKAGVVTVTLDSVPPGASLVDKRTPVRGEPIINHYDPLNAKLTIGIRAGHHQMTAHLDGYTDAVWEFDARPGTKQTHTFELQQPGAAPQPGQGTTPGAPSASDATERPTPTGVYIGLAATGAFAAGTAVTGVLALGKKKDFDTANDGSDPKAAQDLKDSGKTLNLVSDIFLGATVVSGAITAIFYFNRPERPVAQDTAHLSVTPLVGPGGGGVSLTGAF